MKWNDPRKLRLLGILKALGGYITFESRVIRGVRLGEDGKIKTITNSFLILPESDDLINHLLWKIRRFPTCGVMTFRCDGDQFTDREKAVIFLLKISYLHRGEGRLPDVIFSVGKAMNADRLLEYLGKDRWEILP